MDEEIREFVVGRNATMRDVLESLCDSAVAICLMVDNKQLVGVMTDGDVRRAMLQGATLDAPAEPFMTRNFISVSPDVGRTEALDILRSRSITQLPVLDENRRLVGLHLMRELIGARKRDNWALIMAGGKGTRLHPITENIPKPMIPVAGRPILERLVMHLTGFGFQRIFISVHYLKDVIKEHFGDGSAFGCQIEYLEEDRPLGSAGALSLLPERPTQPLLMLNGDLVTQVDFSRMLRFHQSRGNVLTMGVKEYLHTIPYGTVELQEQRIVKLMEKPTVSQQVNTGMYVISPEFFKHIGHNEPVNIMDKIGLALEQNQPVGAYFVEEDWVDAGGHGDLKRARGDL